MKLFYFCLLLIFLSTAVFADETEIKSKLIVFVNSGKTNAALHFEKNALPAIRKIAEDRQIEFQVIDSSKGLPLEITTTPAIVFYSAIGRSIYQGRYLSFDRIINFIETSQNIPQSDMHNTYKDLAVLKTGRGVTGVPIKITEVSGTKPQNYVYKSFFDKSLKVVLKELHGYEFKAQIQSNRTDRFFYMDFYPWVSESGQLFLSASLFSQYHCKAPIWTTEKSPFVGGWNDREILIQQATVRMEEEIKRLSANSLVGDAFDPVSESTKIVTWDDLGLKVQPRKKSEESVSKAEIAKEWKIDSGNGQKGGVQFRLVPPNESYSGFAKKVVAELKFDGEGNKKRMLGTCKVKMDSVTMGDADLDASLLSKEMLNVIGFPVARFDFDVPVNPESFIVYFGREIILDVQGNFTFKEKTIPIKAEFTIEPIVRKGATQLLVKSNFKIDLKDFGLSGAPNYTPEKDIMEFFVTLEMVAK